MPWEVVRGDATEMRPLVSVASWDLKAQGLGAPAMGKVGQ